MHRLNRILVPVDFSPCARRAADYAAFLAERLGAAIDVLHVWRPIATVWEPARDPGPRMSLELFERSEAGRRMKELLAELERERRVPVRGRLESGEPWQVIVEIADETPYDLVVMGTHGRLGLAHLVHGSVAEAVVRRAPCPVITVRDASIGVAGAEVGMPKRHAGPARQRH